jgi:uncharacterized protein YjiS (DUF1127 family)
MSIPRFVDNLIARRRRNRTVRELASLSDHQLKDIGVRRYDLFGPVSPL